jgi:membrane fusion protein
MSSDPQSLFRAEVLAARSDTSSGSSIDIRPVSAGRLTAFFSLLAVAVILVLVFGSYTKKERVTGLLQPTAGVAMVVPPEAGIIKRVMVKEGQVVKAGDVIAEISNERFSDEGNTQALLEQNLQGQRERVQAQSEGQAQAHTATLASLEQRIAQGRRDLITLGEEIKLQEQQIASARKLLDKLTPLAAEHVISELQYEQQRQTLLDQTARLQTLKRQRSATEGDLAQAQDERDRQAAQHQVERAVLDRDLLNLQQEQVQRRGARVTLLRSPIDGMISGLLATPGQAISPNAQVASVVPSNSALEAMLYVPSTAMGFIKPGQDVRIAYDAFPYQRFGLYHGVVSSVSQTDVPLPGAMAAGDRRAMFIVRVALDKPTVRAYNTEIALHPGQSLSADIEIDRRSLMRWMLDPLYAFAGKL